MSTAWILIEFFVWFTGFRWMYAYLTKNLTNTGRTEILVISVFWLPVLWVHLFHLAQTAKTEDEGDDYEEDD